MKVKILVHPAEEGRYWAEVPGVPNCVTEGDTLEEVKRNIVDALEGLLSVEKPVEETEGGEIHEVEV